MNSLLRTKFFPVLMIGLMIAAVVYWFHQSQVESTSYAYVNGRVIQIAPLVSGKVAQVYVEDQQQVKRGDLLFELDQTSFNIAVEQATAQFNEAKRNVKDSEEGMLALKTADEALNSAQLQANHSKIYAPSDGIVTHFSVSPGEVVHANQFLFKIVTTSNLWVDAQFQESQVRHIHPGQVAQLKLASYPDHTFKGVVDSITAGHSDHRWVAVKIRINSDNPDYPIRIGTSGKVNILIHSHGKTPTKTQHLN